MSVPGTSTSHVLENLDKNSYYHVGIVAVNRIGKSEESVFIFKTSLGGRAAMHACVLHSFQFEGHSLMIGETLSFMTSTSPYDLMHAVMCVFSHILSRSLSQSSHWHKTFYFNSSFTVDTFQGLDLLKMYK